MTQLIDKGMITLKDEKIIAQLMSDLASERDIALGEIFKNKALRSSINKAIISNGGNLQDAQNVFHDSILCLMQKTDDRQLNIKKSVDSYLIGIAKNLWLNEIRKRSRHKESTLNDLKTEPLSDDDSQNRLEQAEYRQFLDDVIKQMSFKCRHLLVWDFDDYSAAEIARLYEKKCTEVQYEKDSFPWSDDYTRSQCAKCREKLRAHFSTMINNIDLTPYLKKNRKAI